MIREMTKKLFNDEAGVSPIVATLVLIVVAIAGAAAVGVIMGTFSSDVSKNANSGDTALASSTEILVGGSTTVQPFSEVLAEKFMEKNPGVKISVQGGGSGAGIASVGLGVIDIGSASRVMKDEEKAKYPEVEEYTIGGSAVVVIANGNASAPITKTQLQAIYNATTGTTDVTTLGTTLFTGISTTNKLTVVQRSEVSGTEETFANYLFGSSKANVDDAAAESVTTVVSASGNAGVLAKVETTTNSIGFVDWGYVSDAATRKVSVLQITDGTTTYYPTGDNIKNAVKDRLAEKGSSTKYVYSLCRPLNYLVNGQPSSMALSFLDFARSPEACDLAHDVGVYHITEL